ncbi:YdbH domain-containing protein [Pseudomonas sp. F1_0610]|uniref:intermembrane phospholipid transport protein YdbH family protein n=1 Tax=Pseudomonas sp. F1_0610 TaxID=3114284 RepID=UPI0039C41DF3
MKPALAAVNTKATKTKGYKWLRWLLIVFIVLVSLPFIGWHILLAHLNNNYHINRFDWERSELSLNQLILHDIKVFQSANSLHIKKLALSWQYSSSPIQHLEIENPKLRLNLNELNLTTDSEDNDASPLDLSTFEQWLPKQVSIQTIDADIQDYAYITGDLFIDATTTQRLWQPSNLRTQLSFTHIGKEFTDFVPPEFAPERLLISANTAADIAPSNTQQLALNIDSFGASELHFKSIVTLSNQPRWRGTLSDGDLLLKLPVYRLDDLSAHRLQLQTKLTLEANMQQAELVLSQLQLSINELQQANTRSIKNLSLQADKTTATADLEQKTVAITSTPTLKAALLSDAEWGQITDLNLRLKTLTANLDANFNLALEAQSSFDIKQIKQDNLKKATWTGDGKLALANQQITWQGTLSNSHSLKTSLQAKYTPELMTASLKLDEIYFLAGNPLAKTLKDWPELIEFNSGKLNASAELKLPSTGKLSLTSQARASGLSGIVNRSELKNLGLQLEAKLTGTQLQLSIPNLTFDELNPGVPIGPARLLNFAYQGNISAPLSGKINWERLHAGLFQGQISLNQQQLTLNKEQSLLVDIKGLDIQDVLRIYPAEGLAGQGIIDGKLPILINVEKMQFHVNDGKIGAREAGYLQFSNDKITQMGRANPAMQLVSDALSNFQYQVLKSDVTYDQTGKLRLNLELKGSNPKIEKGRPIHFSISLEEDIPALLASLQLSNHVSETIQKRVKERLQNRKE